MQRIERVDEVPACLRDLSKHILVILNGLSSAKLVDLDDPDASSTS